MSLHLDNEQPIPLTGAAEHIRSRPSISTVRRWSRYGVRGVKLDTRLIGGRRYTTIAAIDRFLERTAERQNNSAARVITNQLSESAVAIAEAHLDAEGL